MRVGDLQGAEGEFGPVEAVGVAEVVVVDGAEVAVGTVGEDRRDDRATSTRAAQAETRATAPVLQPPLTKLVRASLRQASTASAGPTQWTSSKAWWTTLRGWMLLPSPRMRRGRAGWPKIAEPTESTPITFSRGQRRRSGPMSPALWPPVPTLHTRTSKWSSCAQSSAAMDMYPAALSGLLYWSGQ